MLTMIRNPESRGIKIRPQNQYNNHWLKGKEEFSFSQRKYIVLPQRMVSPI